MNKHYTGKRMHRSSGLLLAAAAGICLVPTIGHAQVTFLNSWGSYGSGSGQFDDPAGVAVSASGNVYVTDLENNRVEIFNSFGVYQSSFGSYGSAGGDFAYPNAVAASGSGNVYVADTDNNRVEIFNSSGVYQSSFGSSGSAAGDFAYSEGVAVSGSGNVYVADSGNDRVDIFNSTGVYQSSFGSYGSGPDGVALSGSGNVYVADTFSYSVEIFNSSGLIQSSFGSYGSGSGQFAEPDGVAVSGSGNVYVADGANDRVESFNSSGVYQGSFGSAGSGSGQFSSPNGVAISENGDIYVTDAGNDRVERFFNPSEWVSGTNSFTNSAVGPTSVNVGTGEILGSSLILNSSMSLAVGNTLSLDSSGSLTQTGGAVSTATLNINGEYDYQSGTLSAQSVTVQSGGSFTASSSSNLTFAGNQTNVTVNSGGTFSMSGGPVSLISVTVNSGASFGYGGGDLSTGSLTVASAGTFQATAGGTVSLSQTSDVNGELVLDGGTSFSSSGDVDIATDGLISVGNATVDIFGLFLQSGGELRLNSALEANVSSSNLYSLGLIDGSGLVNGLTQNYGDIDVATGQSLTFSGATTPTNENGGLISLAGGSIHFTGSLNNSQTGNIDGYGTLRVDGGVANAGNMFLGGGSAPTNIYGAITNGGNLDGFLDLTGNAYVFGAITNENSASLYITGTAPNFFYQRVDNSHGGYITIAAGATAYFLGGVDGSQPVVNAGVMGVEAASTSGNIVGGGNLTIGPTTGAAGLQIAPNSGASIVSSLNILSGAQLDLTNNHMFIDYGSGSDPIASIAASIKSGYAGGAWNGPGIISSTAQSLTNGLRYGVGWADGADGVVSGLSSGQIEIKYTLLGDANLDGVVNGSDFSILAANFGKGVTNWDQGNFLYGSSVNGSDFSALAANFGQGDSGAAVAVSPADIAALDSFAIANGLPLPTFAAVPEPASLSLLVASGAMLIRRRSRRLRNQSAKQK
jgi:DNA-binding beta-propeller fold protein YncE